MPALSNFSPLLREPQFSLQEHGESTGAFLLLLFGPEPQISFEHLGACPKIANEHTNNLEIMVAKLPAYYSRPIDIRQCKDQIQASMQVISQAGIV